jgi:hypothetical protein
MIFKKRESKPVGWDPETGSIDPFDVDDVPQAHRVAHRNYTIIPKTKQLHNGKWIVEIVLEEERPEGNRRYDFFGPMTEFSSEEEAREAGVEHAKARLDTQ